MYGQNGVVLVSYFVVSGEYRDGRSVTCVKRRTYRDDLSTSDTLFTGVGVPQFMFLQLNVNFSGKAGGLARVFVGRLVLVGGSFIVAYDFTRGKGDVGLYGCVTSVYGVFKRCGCRLLEVLAYIRGQFSCL